MNRSGLRKLLLGGSVAALAAWGVIDRLLPDAGPAEAQAATAGESDESVTLVSPTDAADGQPAVRNWPVATAWPENPFFRVVVEVSDEPASPASEPVPDEPRLILQALISGPTALAMINSEVVAVGQRLADGTLVTAIEADSVTLRGTHGIRTLELSE